MQRNFPKNVIRTYVNVSLICGQERSVASLLHISLV